MEKIVLNPTLNKDNLFEVKFLNIVNFEDISHSLMSNYFNAYFYNSNEEYIDIY